MQNLALKQDGLPLGRSESKDWPGGRAQVTVEGTFLTGNGVGTSVSMNHQVKRNDGSFSRGAEVAVFHESGEREISLSPGVFYFWASGPDGAPWSAYAKVGHTPKQAKQPSVQQRLRALEGGKRKGRKS